MMKLSNVSTCCNMSMKRLEREVTRASRKVEGAKSAGAKGWMQTRKVIDNTP